MLNFVRMMTPSSALRYSIWKLAQKQSPLRVKLRSGIAFWLRRDRVDNTDYGVAYEVFVHDYYRPPPSVNVSSVRFVVDLGGNVGLSALHWLNVFPNARVEVYEPHPQHVVQLVKNLKLSGQQARVTVRSAAAGASSRRVGLSANMSSSSTLTEGGEKIDVPMEDIFPSLLNRRIDVLKMDIEGGEYELLDDARFELLDIGAVVMEWHARKAGDADRRWCEARLSSMGYRLQTIFAEPGSGMFWAIKGPSTKHEGQRLV